MCFLFTPFLKKKKKKTSFDKLFPAFFHLDFAMLYMMIFFLKSFTLVQLVLSSKLSFFKFYSILAVLR